MVTDAPSQSWYTSEELSSVVVIISRYSVNRVVSKL
jgi:hypothetical protein